MMTQGLTEVRIAPGHITGKMQEPDLLVSIEHTPELVVTRSHFVTAYQAADGRTVPPGTLVAIVEDRRIGDCGADRITLPELR